LKPAKLLSNFASGTCHDLKKSIFAASLICGVSVLSLTAAIGQDADYNLEALTLYGGKTAPLAEAPISSGHEIGLHYDYTF
jgi:hypothetical protein